MLQSTPQMLFSTGPRVLDARLDLDALTSDGGLVWSPGPMSHWTSP